MPASSEPVRRDRFSRAVRDRFDRVRRTAARYPLLLDAGLAVLLLVVSVVGEIGEPHAGPRRALVFDALLTAPLLLRRRSPTGVFLTISAVALAQWAVGTQAQADLAVLVALYTMGAYEPRRWRIALAATIAEVGVVLATLRWAPPGRGWSIALLLTGTVTAAWVLGVYLRTRRAYLAAVVHRAATAERERDNQARLAVAAERARIAREMHDVVAHSLTVMIALTDGAATTVFTEPSETLLTIRQASTVGRQSLGEMRRLVGVLRADEQPQLDPQPGSSQLGELIDQVRAAGLPVRLTVTGRPDTLPAGAQLAVHRIVQESLTNVLKHAPSAPHTLVRLDYRPDEVEVEVTNERPTVEAPPGPADRQGHGLLGMQERAAVYGGHVQAGSGSDGSWRVRARLTLRDDRVFP